MEIYTLFPRSFGANCYLLVSGNKAAVIDPSVDADAIMNLAAKKNATIKYIILTHGHFDHISSIDTLRDITHAPVLIHRDDNEMLTDGMKNAHSFFFGYEKKWRPADTLIENGDALTLGNDVIRVISTPGHSKGSVCLLSCDKLITGDTLFASGYGRYDLYGGDIDQLECSLSHLKELDPTLTIYPGHGSNASLGQALDNLLYY
jgi:glyoxylase-like metal-dependent hydrolase (beta-lactamase superfamily II)